VWKFTIELEEVHGHMPSKVKNVEQKNPRHMKFRRGI
jgi:hypothetical protein